MISRKGIAFGIPIFMLVGMIAIVSVFIFGIFFKVHVTGIAVDVDSVNRYQEIPTTVLGITYFGQSIGEIRDQQCASGDSRCTAIRELLLDLKPEASEVNCFNGNGPAGSHPESPNEHLCTKKLSFYYTKVSNSLGVPIFGGGGGNDIRIRDQIRSSLPDRCFRYAFESDGVDDVLYPSDGSGSTAGCTTDEGIFKLNEEYPIPIFMGAEPAIAIQRLYIGTSTENGEDFFITWPKHSLVFDFREGV